MLQRVRQHLMQDRDIAQSEVQPLRADRRHDVGGFSDQRRAPLCQGLRP